MKRPAASKPFLATRYTLPGGLALSRMTANEAVTAGNTCAAMDPWLSYPFTAEELIAFFALIEPDAPRFTLRADGEFAGALTVRRNWLRGPYVHMLMVARAFQRRGFGTAMLEWTEREALQGRDRNLWIAVTSTNSAARRLYERAGFRNVADLDGLVRDDHVEVLMRKRLS